MMPPSKRESPVPGRYKAGGVNAKPTFSGCDLELFKTGALADIVVSCMDQEFRVHKAILAGRSSWFTERLLELEQIPREPGQIPNISLPFCDPHDLKCVLGFIYAGEIDPNITSDESFLSSCVRLYNLGHDFGVKGMPDFATKELGNYLSHALQMMSDLRLSVPAASNIKGRTELQDRLRENNFVAHFLAAVECADRVRQQGGLGGHEDRQRPFQMLVDFFIAGKHILLQEPELEIFLDGDVVPAFAKTVLLTERKGGARSKWMKELAVRPCPPTVVKVLAGRKAGGVCYLCGTGMKNIKMCGGAAFLNPRSREDSYSQVCCLRCVENEDNIDGNGLMRWDVFDPRKK